MTRTVSNICIFFALLTFRPQNILDRSKETARDVPALCKDLEEFLHNQLGALIHDEYRIEVKPDSRKYNSNLSGSATNKTGEELDYSLDFVPLGLAGASAAQPSLELLEELQIALADFNLKNSFSQ